MYFLYELIVGRSDNDQYSHINNSVYYHLFDSIVNTYLIAKCRLSPSTSNKAPNLSISSSQDAVGQLQQIGLVLSSHCTFFHSLSFPQTLHLGLRVTSLTRSTVSYEIGVFAEDEDAVSVVGGYTHVFVDRDTRRSGKDGMAHALRDGLSKLINKSGEVPKSSMKSGDVKTRSKL